MKRAVAKAGGPLALIGILVLTAVLFAPSLRYDFLNWDDQEHIYEHPYVRTLNARTLLGIFTDTRLNAYFPLTTLSFALEYQAVGADPFIYRVNNLLLHLGIVSLIFILAGRLSLPTPAAAAAALIFAIHPMHVESVVWITERKDLLYSFFYLLALNRYVIYVREKNREAYWASFIFGLLSMLAKPMAVSLPFILLLIDWFLKRRLDRCAVMEKIPFLLYALPLFAVTFLAHDRVPGGAGAVTGSLILIWTVTFYLWKFIWPYPLNPLYSLPEPVTFANPPYLFAALLLAAVVFLAVRLRHQRWWIFALAYYIMSIAIMLKIDAVETSLVADRYMYLPSLGFCLLAGYGWSRLLARGGAARWPLVVASVVLVAVLGFYSCRYSKIWQNSFSLWSYVIAQPGARPIAFNNRGNLYLDRGNTAAALADYNEALRRDPRHVSSLINRSLVYLRMGRREEARADYERARAIAPETVRAFFGADERNLR